MVNFDATFNGLAFADGKEPVSTFGDEVAPATFAWQAYLQSGAVECSNS